MWTCESVIDDPSIFTNWGRVNPFIPVLGNTSEIVLSRLKKAYGLTSDADLAQFFGVGTSTVANWKKRDSIPFKHILESCPTISYDWLFRGEGKPFLATVKTETALGGEQDQPPDDLEIPIYKLTIDPQKAQVVDRLKTHSFWLRDWLEDELGIDAESAFIVDTDASSGSERFYPGDKVVGVHQDFGEDGLYAVIHRDLIWVRHVSKFENIYLLTSWNPNLQSIGIPEGGDIQFIGRIAGVLAHMRR